MINVFTLLFEHGDHVQSVVLELLVFERDRDAGTPMMLRSAPAHIRLLNMN
jgi:hypothetical protein